MKLQYLLYGILVGLLPFILGIMAEGVAPHSAAAQLPWLSIILLPLGTLVGLILALFL
jgi:hypothetical protein